MSRSREDMSGVDASNMVDASRMVDESLESSHQQPAKRQSIISSIR